MIVHRKQHIRKFTFELEMNGIQIEQVASFEYLGLTIQENLNWDVHLDKVISKISRISGVINRLGNNVNNKTLLSIYYAHVYSHLSYMYTV